MNTPSYRDYHFIVSGDAVLTQANTLPYSENPYHFWQICEAVNHFHNLHLSTLRCLTILEQDSLICRLYAQEYHGGAIPEGFSWLQRSKLENLQSPFPIADLESYWESLSAGNQAEWYQLGFYEKIAPQFSQKLEQLRSWERSAVWRLNGTEKQYLKLVPPMFQHEIPLCHWLQAQFPDSSVKLLPSPIGMLMADYGSVSLFQRLELPIWEESMRVYAQMQIQAIQHKESLLGLGLPERSLAWLAATYGKLLADDATLQRGLYPLSAEEIAKLRAAIPRLQEACQKLAASNLPDTLEHGDLWAGQIIVHEEKILITDWSDSAWTQPIFSLIFFLAEIHNDFADEPKAYEACKMAYLQQWQSFAPMPVLEEAFQAATLLSPLYSALRYYEDVLPNMRQAWEMENMLAYNLRLLLKALG